MPSQACSIVWTPIPVVTWLFPFIGHTGITSSPPDGLIRDFLGHGFVNDSGKLGFGAPTRILHLDAGRVAHRTERKAPLSPAEPEDAGPRPVSDFEAWDSGIARATRTFERCNYNFLTNNCHSFVAMALSEMRYGGRQDFNMAHIAIMVVLKGKHIGLRGLLKTWLPWFVIMGLGLYFWRWAFAVAWLCASLLLGGSLAVYAFRHPNSPPPQEWEPIEEQEKHGILQQA